MKKNISKLAFLVLLSILIVGCNNGERSIFSRDNQVQFDTLVVEKKYYLNNDTANPYCDLNVHFVYPIKSSKTELNRLQQLFISNTLGQMYGEYTPKEAIELYTNNFVKNYEADALIFQDELEDLENHPNLIPSNLDAEHENELQSNSFYSYYETLSSKVYFNENNLLSFQVNRYNNKGGSATYSSHNNYVINLRTGDLLTEGDIFTPGYDVALQQLFEKVLMQENNVKTVSDLENLGYFGIEEIMPNRNFLIDNKGITYIFNKGEYSAYLLDAPEVFISFDELRMLLKKNTVVSKLAEQ